MWDAPATRVPPGPIARPRPPTVDPMFGNLLDADALIRDAHDLALRIIVDLVPNHSPTSTSGSSGR